MLYARLKVGPQRDEAREIIEARWKTIDPDTWKDRLREGDISAWREMLLGFAIGKPSASRDKIFKPLESEAEFAQSDLRFVPLARRSMLCEAYFYDALIAESETNQLRRDKSLWNVLDTNQRDYYEYKMALFLLERSWMFSVDDFTGLPSLTARLRKRLPTDQVSSYLWGQLDADTQKLLSSYSGGLNMDLQRAMAVQLNRIVVGPSIYDPGRFGGVALRQETKDLLESNPQRVNQARLNRLLLEDAYPLELSRNGSARQH